MRNRPFHETNKYYKIKMKIKIIYVWITVWTGTYKILLFLALLTKKIKLCSPFILAGNLRHVIKFAKCYKNLILVWMLETWSNIFVFKSCFGACCHIKSWWKKILPKNILGASPYPWQFQSEIKIKNAKTELLQMQQQYQPHWHWQ